MQAQSGKTLHLFKLSGARILNEQVSVNGKNRPWTVGNYLAMLRKGAGSVKMGFGSIATVAMTSLSQLLKYIHIAA